MTLTTLSNKEFRSLFKWSFKRNRSIMIIYSILLAICGPVINLYALATTGTSSYNGIAEDMCITTFIIYACITALFVLISAIKTFSFLHNKRSVDMYGALPSNRTTLFVSHLCAGITSIGVPYLVASVIILGITARLGSTFSTGLTSILSTALMIIASYIFTALMAYCCGTVADTIIAVLAINGIWTAAVALYFRFMERLIPGATFESVLTTPILTAFTPYGFGIMGMFAYNTDTDDIFFITTLIWDVVFIVGFFILTLFIANKRKAESSQNGFAAKWLPMVIKSGVSVVAGAFFGFLFAETSSSGFSNMGVYVFWYMIISLVAFGVLHVIFARGLKGKILQSVIVYAATTVASVALVIGMCYGLGIDTYVPSADSIKSVKIDNYELKDPENIKLVTEIHQVIADGIRNENEYPYYLGSHPYYDSLYNDYSTTSYIYSDDYAVEVPEETNGLTYEDYERMYQYIEPFSFNITYDKKVGFDVERDYYISSYMGRYDYYDLEKLNELVKQLVSSEEYKKLDNSYLFDKETQNKGTLTSATLTNYIWSKTDNSYRITSSAILDTDEVFLNGLYEALKKDILADKEYILIKYNNYNDYNDFADILGNSYSFIEIELKIHDESYYQSYYTSTESFCIKDSYTNTNEYLENHSISMTPSLDEDSFATSSYYEDLNSFTNTGSYYYLKSLVENHCYLWSSMICEYSEVDFNEWYNEHYDDYSTKIMDKSLELYNEMQRNYGYGEYSDGYEYYYDYYAPTYEESEELIAELIAYTREYIADTVDFSSDIDSSDTDKDDSDTDSKETTSEDTESKKSSSDNETSSGSENSSSKTTSAATQSMGTSA